MGGHVEVNDATAIVAEHDKDVEGLEPQRRNGEEVAGPDLNGVPVRSLKRRLHRAAVEPPVAERRARLASGRGGGCTVRTVHRCLLVHAQTRLNLTVRALRSDAAVAPCWDYMERLAA